MPKTWTSREIIKVLKNKGFEIDHTTGSHYVFLHSATHRRVVAPYHNKDLPKGTLLSILKQAGISKQELRK
ncbi:MAG: hypothetical protein A3I88_03110 [Candidatus Portnoybacteria bacterium RIFCSPLOWO2_12_FULL_39_9]|uniref:Addiction module toxin, HicA family n=1 Tax=Candidatus Portnoybacteria bacterium RIFCSPHIGHO2_12_FULL_38_9 TaxID=1801997 RepID=A0A1G2FGT8_9BACT|nr:MAG: hypothetical protein A3H00_03195 [Candidatus Portnoybacteria bacterium RBG_13_40_8]OGZ36226.1 MAG: hypothetical protein A2646_02370 [Candidatus Portnoybacteria bacterium RIFCSPHIGHO2_02_FULL_39_12]OGZ36798.1 MAG: hypothetical protein A3J64_02535 [Candidatus Portnoybacteria bacterium RIFCSPHIGHO2_12_FULL_38_9]OGZ38061.1 MAG: hypothetical protein A3F21_00460 [Candidatus Portnoybacteria bacterium RIFCSPLOWO2_01_FULL_38_39]OGZ41091.1 MAG: hypothetical protein A3I88_03110 [Candidatus Portnoy